VIQLAHNAVVAKLMNLTQEAKLDAQDILSYTADGFGKGDWDGKASFFDYKSCMFPAGFASHVQAGLIKRGHKVGLVRKPLPEPLGPEFPVVDEFGYTEKYDYQPAVMQKLLSHGQIIAQVATGGGKSRIARMCHARINRRTLFLTTRNVLLYQMKENYEQNLKQKVPVYGDGQWAEYADYSKAPKFNVGMVQSFAERLKDPDPYASPSEREKQIARRADVIRLLHSFDFVILEEAHEVSGNGFYDIMCECKNAHYRLALTATPFMKDNEEANMRLMAVSGSIAIRITEQMLIDRGVLAKPIFKFAQLKETDARLRRSTPWQRAYKYGIVECEYRNKYIVAEAKRAKAYGLTAMVLVQHKEHGNTLQKMFAKYGLRAKFIFGESEQKERKQALRELETGKLDVLIGSTILDVGVDVPSVGMIILAGGGKAEVALRQRIGRGLRSKKIGPNIALILDFSDHFNNYTREHAINRRAIVEKTPGFAEGIIRNGGDFNYEELGFARLH
jgi:superfamily II DNA or RNA helicase